jgi:deoxycytidylate deaminase/dephospho-CoA kinase
MGASASLKRKQAPVKLLEKAEKADSYSEIKSRQTPELVIALCGAIGSGTSTVVTGLKKILSSYDYKVDPIKLSDFIKKYSTDKSLATKLEGASPFNTYDLLQTEGNNLRKQYSTDILAQLAIYEITMERAKYEKSLETNQESHLVRRHATIIDSLKHPDEWRLLKTVYGNMFYLVGVLCPETIRQDRLIRFKDIPKQDAGILIERDKYEKYENGEEFDCGQQFIKTIFHADFFVRNLTTKQSATEKPLKRFINLLLSDNKYTPTIDEYAMHIAQATAQRSSCLSRQVGAAIVSKDNDVISAGRNDAPKCGGGLYCEDDEINYSCAHTAGCMSEVYKDRIEKDVNSILKKYLKDKLDDDTVKKLSREVKHKTKVKDLIEFSKSVHAEMDAILSAARKCAFGLVGSTLYCTTFPCHQCARHIIAAGISRVFYIEPYEKSLAWQLYGDEIILDSETTDSVEGKLKILPFEGVAPRQYMELFKEREKKDRGKLKEIDLKKSKPITEQLMDSFTDYEDKVVLNLKKSMPTLEIESAK